jgi:hypothetical protein
MQHATLRKNHHPDRHEPVSFKAGEQVTLGRPDGDWPGYVAATDPRGRQGRVPLSYLDGAVARRDFDGTELEGNVGDPVRLLELCDGWWWAENAIGEKGWLPEHAILIEPGIK